MKLSVIIVNWNSRDFLRNCLESLRTQDLQPAPQVIVVDGGSFDGCDEMLAAEFPAVEFVQSRENIGFGRCNNLGLARVKGELVLLLNPDTELHPGAIPALIEALETQPSAGVVGARLLNTDGTLQQASIHPLPTPLNVALDSNWLRQRWWARHGPAAGGPTVDVEAVSGACMLMRSELFRQLGGFNPIYFMYAEDMDLCLKVRRSGLRAFHVPAAVVTHHGGGSAKTRFSKFSTVMIREAIDAYMKTNHGAATALRSRALIGLSALLRLALLAPAWIFSAGQVRRKRRDSIARWCAILRWTVGREKWAREYFPMDRRTGQALPENHAHTAETASP